MDFEAFINKNIPDPQSFHPHYASAIEHVLKNGGKRFRPQLIFATVNAYSPDLLQKSYPVAFAFEMMHTYSLIHDDLPAMDNADFRRSQPTLHKLYDEVTAILVGDALNTHSFYLLASCDFCASKQIKLIKALAQGGGLEGMVLGQAIDCFFENKPLSLEQLKFLHLRKTGVLIANSLKAGATICDLDEEAFFSLGLDLGLLFQIQDDILDATITPEQAGKPTQNDGDKNTFVSLLGIDEAKKAKEELSSKIIKDLDSFSDSFKQNLTALIKKYL